MMKKIVLVMFVVIHSYATSDTILALQSTFKKNINEYYKLWAVGYCMGHFEVERNVKFEFQEMPARFSIDDLKISKIVYLLGVEPLNEIKDYIDKNNSYFEKDKANHCLELLLKPNYKPKSHHSLDDEVKRIVKKYCKDCK